MAKSMGNFRDSRTLSWLSAPCTDAPDEPPLKGPTLYLPIVSWQIRTLPLLCTSPLQNLGEYASILEKIACHSS
jgi:hypothetical protein